MVLLGGWRRPIEPNRHGGLTRTEGVVRFGGSSVLPPAEVAKPADAADLKSAARKGVGVRIPSSAPSAVAAGVLLHCCSRFYHLLQLAFGQTVGFGSRVDSRASRGSSEQGVHLRGHLLRASVAQSLTGAGQPSVLSVGLAATYNRGMIDSRGLRRQVLCEGRFSGMGFESTALRPALTNSVSKKDGLGRWLPPTHPCQADDPLQRRWVAPNKG